MRLLFIWLAVLVFNLTLGAMSINYLSNTLFQKDIPWYGDVLVGLVAAQVSVPLAFVVWIFNLFL
jgi:hypothetical protein